MKPPSLAPAYAFIVPQLVEVARGMGYALALHGSMTRDLDLVACPWTEDAVPAEDLAAAIDAGVRWTTTGIMTGPEAKPHGRQAWCIPLMAGAYIDLSVMPRVAP